ncbi:MAG: PocR ligand-binding domain-containing protein [Oscillospiraceae bacterium]|nr:PocR ligand-binding domain-containing protein [Oscillospiraceae bacterium]
MDNENNLYITDLIDAEVLQQLQDAFSDLTGMAALTSDSKGVAVTEGSNFTDFCFKYTRPTELGRKRCEKCDMHGAELTLANGSSCSYYCHAGLMDFAAPIMANGEMVGSFIGGQVLTEPPNIEKIRKTAVELGIDPDEYEEAVKKVPIVSRAQVEKASHFLYVFATILSNIAYKGYALHKSNLEIEKASHMKSDFLANMSHEIRTPMNAVLGLADLALREEMSASAREYIHQIKASSKNLLVIINDILDFSKIESGKMDINEVEYEPLSLINDLTSIVNSRIGSKEIEFTMDISPDLPKSLYGDSVRIHQIILNLLTNAVKFTHHGEVHFKIDFELKDEDTAVMKAEVSDTGIGIKKKDMQKIFNSFQQVDSKRNRNIEGTGLGLAITRQLLDLMGGKISVESEYEKGTTFYFEVPQKIVDATPIVPKLKKSFKTAVLVSNDYVKRQIIRDLNWIGAEYTDLADKSSYKDLRVDYLIVEKLFFTKTIKEVLAKYSDMQCLVLADYDSLDAIDIPNVRVISKPVYSLSLYNAMGIQEISFEGGISEGDSFTFVAPDAHILVVDDNAVNLTVAKGLLEPLNMTIDLASSAAEAIEKIHYTKYDLIFMDHMMPEVDGVEATHIIRRLVPSYNDVPIIALTANAIGGAKEMFLKEGMNDFIAKPIDVKDTVSKLRKWLPKEKILPVDKPDDSDIPEQDTTASGSGSDTVNIKELNTKEAISRLGSEKLFWTVLKEYFGAIDKKYSAILEHKEAERWRDYTIEVHALKSTSRQIGADHISEIAAEMEKAGNEGNIALINEKTGPMLEEYLQLKEALKPYFADASEGEERFAQIEEILAMLEKMQTALDEFDTLQIDEVIEEMSKFKYPDENALFFEQLKKSAEESNIDDCLNIVNQWGTVLVKSVSDGDKVIHMLGDLQDALDKFDTLEVDAVIEKMAKNSFPYSGVNKSYFQQLQEAAKNGDFEMCAEIADHWSRAIVDIYS